MKVTVGSIQVQPAGSVNENVETAKRKNMLLTPPVAAATAAMLVLVAVPTQRALHFRQQKIQSARVIAPDPPALLSSLAAADPGALCVRTAGVKGKGLYSTIDIAADTYICDYSGDIMNAYQHATRYPPTQTEAQPGSQLPDYVIETASDSGVPFYVDARDEVQGSPGRWLNHASDGTHACNVHTAAFWPASDRFLDLRLCMYTDRDVKAGEELSWDYVCHNAGLSNSSPAISSLL